MIKPIGPHDKLQSFPDEVMLAFNNLLTAKMNKGSITITQDQAIDEIIKTFKLNGKRIDRAEIFDNDWLDVEPNYRAAGWKVSFDKPGYCETYSAFYKFSKI